MTVVKPLIKWVGGKTQIIDNLYEKFQSVIKDKPIENYYEIFLGGGAVLLALLSWIKEGKIKTSKDFKIRAYDLNKNLINMFINVRDNPKEIYDLIKPMIDYYNSVNDNEKESYYYQVREHFNNISKNPTDIATSAAFIFLNKTGFRGLYREGPRGYNVPFGHYKNPEILNYEHLMEISSLIQDVEFEVADFSHSINFIQSQKYNKEYANFVYLDPPYAPENSKSFTKYNESDFSLEKHNLLFELCHKLSIPFIMSNSNTELVRDSFVDKKYTLEEIDCKRRINSKNPESKTVELIIIG